MSQWIWKFGEFENYHSLLLHSSRQNYGYIEPVVWKQYPCEPVVVFKKEVTTAGGEIPHFRLWRFYRDRWLYLGRFLGEPSLLGTKGHYVEGRPCGDHGAGI